LSVSVRIRLAAKLDIAEAEDWYDNRVPGLGLEFRLATYEAVASIASDPFVYPELLWGNRRLVMHRFPYNIWFRVSGKTWSLVSTRRTLFARGCSRRFDQGS